jgi:hypothetical protein
MFLAEAAIDLVITESSNDESSYKLRRRIDFFLDKNSSIWSFASHTWRPRPKRTLYKRLRGPGGSHREHHQ